MAFKLPSLKFFSQLDARSRIFFLLAAVVATGFVVYLIVLYFSGGADTTGPSRVANAPGGLQSVPGSQLTPEYYRALSQANAQAAQQAQISGGSAVPTLINVPGQQALGAPTVSSGGVGQCNIICPEESSNVKYDLDDWVKQGKISPDLANQLQQEANQNVPVEQYAAMLDQLVKSGKLTPDEARALLARYRAQHANALLQQSASVMDSLIKAGQLPLSVANQLLAAQKEGMTAAQYSNELSRLVAEGKISPQVAQQLLAQYTQQRVQEMAKQGDVQLQQMAKQGQITAEVEKTLADLQKQNLPVTQYAAELQKLVAEGKLTPAVAAKLLAQYQKQRQSLGPAATLDALIKQAQAAGNEQKLNALRIEAQRLQALQGNNASVGEYINELKSAVQSGVLTPSEAAELAQEYQALTLPLPSLASLSTPAGSAATTAATADFAKLQQQMQQASTNTPGSAITSVTPGTSAETAQFAAAQQQAQAAAAQARAERLRALMDAMSSQSQQLITAWQAPTMSYQGGSVAASGKGSSGAGSSATTTTASAAPKPVVIKAGTVIFAVLDTAVNSDYPTTPVMATIVEGPFKGGKLLGKLNVTQSTTGQMDRVSLSFNLMNLEAWTASRSVSAFAIDPDTARTVLASHVDYHYLKRYGAMMAASFVNGYANAITTSGATTTTGIFGTSTTHPNLSPSQNIAVGLGQVGQTIGSSVQNYVNIPPTVKVDSGVSLGILFMSDVTM